jgi:hypothetical protein
MEVQNVLFGPFIGDFSTEIITTRPYVRWIYEVLRPEKIFVATHSNRCFLYDWAETIPVFEDLSRDELNQNGVMHNSVSQKDLMLITKKIKSLVAEKDILHINVMYSKNPHWYPLYKKIYTPILLNEKKKKTKTILFIPTINEKYAITKEIYDSLLEDFGEDVIVAGDMKTHLHENNVMFRNPTYFKDIYYDMVRLISNAKVVITPTSHWTLISQLQGTPVISWGSMPRYYDGSQNDLILPEDIPLLNLKKLINTYINSIK